MINVIFRFIILLVPLSCNLVSIYFTFLWFYKDLGFTFLVSFALAVSIVLTISVAFIVTMRLFKLEKKAQVGLWVFIWFVTSFISMFSTFVSIYKKNSEIKNEKLKQISEVEAIDEKIKLQLSKIEGLQRNIDLFLVKTNEFVLRKVERFTKQKNEELSKLEELYKQKENIYKKRETVFEFISLYLFANIIKAGTVEVIITALVAIFIDIVAPLVYYFDLYEYKTLLLFSIKRDELDKIKEHFEKDEMINKKSKKKKKKKNNVIFDHDVEKAIKNPELIKNNEVDYKKILISFVKAMYNNQNMPKKFLSPTQLKKIFSEKIYNFCISVLKEIKHKDKPLFYFSQKQGQKSYGVFALNDVLEILKNLDNVLKIKIK